MAIEHDVFNPPTVNKLDPKATKGKEEGTEYWTKMAEEAKAMMDYQKYVTAMQMLGQTPESPFKVTGEFNLGKVDVQEQQRQAQEAATKAQEAADKKVEDERKRGDNLQSELYKERMDGLRRDFDTQFTQLNQTIEKLATAPKKDERPIYEQFAEQFKALQEIAKQLGLEKTSTGEDANVTIELAKLNYQQAKEDREFKWKMKQDDKQFQLDMQRLQDQRENDRAKLAQEGRRIDMLASFPEQIGAAILQGAQARQQDKVASGAQRGGGQQSYHIELGEGEQAVTNCPYCKADIGVGPTSTVAECVGCKSKFPIIRKPAGQTAATKEPNPDEEEE